MARLLARGRFRQVRCITGHVPPRETHYPARPLSGSNFSTAPTFRTPRNKGNKQPNPGVSVPIQQLVLATKTPPESDNGGAESAVDSDLKSRADDDDMADEAEEP